MLAHSRLVIIPIAYFVFAPACFAQTPASKDQADRVTKFLDAQVAVLKSNSEGVNERIAAMNEVERRTRRIINSASSANVDSMANAAEAMVRYEQALRALNEAVAAQGTYTERVDNVFMRVEQNETAGVLPTGTLTVGHREARDEAKVDLSTATAAVSRLGQTKNEVTGIAEQKRVPIPRVREGERPAGLELISTLLPPEEVPLGVPQHGFFLVANNSDTTIYADFGVEIGGPATVSPAAPTAVSVPPRGVRRFDFSVTLNEAGQAQYVPYIRNERRTPEGPQPFRP